MDRNRKREMMTNHKVKEGVLEEMSIVVSSKITDNIRVDKQNDFLKRQNLLMEYTKSGIDFNYFVQNMLNEKKLSVKHVQDFFFEDLFYGYQRDTYVYNVCDFEKQYVTENKFLKRVQQYYSYVDNNRYNNIINIIGDIEEKQLVAMRVFYGYDVKSIIKVKMIFGKKNPVYKKGGVKDTISYIPVEWDIVKQQIVIKVAPKRRPVDSECKPEYLNKFFLKKMKDMFEIKIQSFESIHKETICEMSRDLYMQIYNKMVSKKPAGIDAYVKEISSGLNNILKIEALELKATMNNIFNIEDNLKKNIENIMMADVMYEMKNGSYEGIQGVVTYLKFKDGKHIRARLKGENCCDPIFDSETYMALRSAIENAQQIQRLAVVWLEEFDKLRVTYDATDDECLNIHFYKNLSSEEFEYALQEYREYEKGIKNKDDSLFEMESQAQ